MSNVFPSVGSGGASELQLLPAELLVGQQVWTMVVYEWCKRVSQGKTAQILPKERVPDVT